MTMKRCPSLKVGSIAMLFGLAACATTTGYDRITGCATTSERSWYGATKSLHVECMDGTIVDNGVIVRQRTPR
ncbi:hypothetical protein WJ74_22450 [Burkholderia ubonensis]|uniref:hypothetical protein n=1 Tax=Burkholderia ubonensis TaxID=101571 RepID=UPI0007523F71|nr:hypothetical protein [Burkholderia ubonensis]KVO30705.1 hypothetical protein WJ74_22450 [Burkholderia ubonensis]